MRAASGFACATKNGAEVVDKWRLREYNVPIRTMAEVADWHEYPDKSGKQAAGGKGPSCRSVWRAAFAPDAGPVQKMCRTVIFPEGGWSASQGQNVCFESYSCRWACTGLFFCRIRRAMRKVPFLTLEKAPGNCGKGADTLPHLRRGRHPKHGQGPEPGLCPGNPGFREYFAVKATPNPYILQILHEEGCGCDCATYSELLLSEAAGITGREVMFSSNVTPEQDLRKAWQMGAYINLWM